VSNLIDTVILLLLTLIVLTIIGCAIYGLCLVFDVAIASADDEVPGLLSWKRAYPTLALGYRSTWMQGGRFDDYPLELAVKYGINRHLALKTSGAVSLWDPLDRREFYFGGTVNLRAFFEKRE